VDFGLMSLDKAANWSPTPKWGNVVEIPARLVR
jgi:hypothetical protein